MDSVLDWVDVQKGEVDHKSFSDFPMLDGIGVEPREASRQLWALLGPLVANDSTVHTVFANCARHNGLEAWRCVAEPINEDKVLILKELLPAVPNPRPAKSIEDLPSALESWDTNLRPFKTAAVVWSGGGGPEEVEFYLPLAT